MIKGNPKIFIGVAAIVILLMVLIAMLHKQDHQSVVERDIENAGESVQHVVTDGAEALRSAAEGVNDVVYK